MTSRLLVDNICSPKTDVHHNSSKLIDSSSEFRRVGDKSPHTSRWATVGCRVVDCRHTKSEHTPYYCAFSQLLSFFTDKKEGMTSHLFCEKFPFQQLLTPSNRRLILPEHTSLPPLYFHQIAKLQYTDLHY